jgi:hypothetical protein
MRIKWEAEGMRNETIILLRHDLSSEANDKESDSECPISRPIFKADTR